MTTNELIIYTQALKYLVAMTTGMVIVAAVALAFLIAVIRSE